MMFQITCSNCFHMGSSHFYPVLESNGISYRYIQLYTFNINIYLYLFIYIYITITLIMHNFPRFSTQSGTPIIFQPSAPYSNRASPSIPSDLFPPLPRPPWYHPWLRRQRLRQKRAIQTKRYWHPWLYISALPYLCEVCLHMFKGLKPR